VQRRSRIDYLKELNLELSTLPCDEEYITDEVPFPRVSCISANDATQGQDNNFNTLEMFPVDKRRKDQFLFRINAIEEEINQLKEAKELASEDLVFLSSEIEKIQQRILELHAEVDRASTFNGTNISSSVIHGNLDQSFTVDQLIEALYFEIERCQEDISSRKAGIIESIRTQSSANEAILTKKDLLKERKAAFFNFQRCMKASQINKICSSANTYEMPRIILKRWLEFSKWQVKIHQIHGNLWRGKLF